MAKVAVLLSLLLASCALDEGHIVNVAPSAQGQMATVEAAVDRLNEMAGATTWWARTSDSESRRDGEIIVRQDNGVRVSGNDIVGAETNRTVKGVVIHISAGCTERAFAHELGHAGGLGHVRDPGNLMFRRDVAGAWTLTDQQLDDIR